MRMEACKGRDCVCLALSVIWRRDNKSHLGIQIGRALCKELEAYTTLEGHGSRWLGVVDSQEPTQKLSQLLPVSVGTATPDPRDSQELAFCPWVFLQLPAEMTKSHVGFSHWMTLTWFLAGKGWRIWPQGSSLQCRESAEGSREDTKLLYLSLLLTAYHQHVEYSLMPRRYSVCVG